MKTERRRGRSRRAGGHTQYDEHRMGENPDDGGSPRHEQRSATEGHPEKHCTVCGRLIEMRRAWRQDWDKIKRCSKACRGTSLTSDDRAAEALLWTELKRRGRRHDLSEKVFIECCARAGLNLSKQAFRNAARRASIEYPIEWRVQGRTVEPSFARGAVSFRLKR